jgi:hypothetical protein
MKVIIRTVPNRVAFAWPEDWPLPPVGGVVEIHDWTYRVHDVIFYPWGDRDHDYPYIYLVLQESS